jgi:hypothetical protein
LIRKAAKDRVEVEHILAVAAIGDPSMVRRLKALKQERGWPDRGRIAGSTNRIVPLGRWCDYLCEFLEGGCRRMVDLALDPCEVAIDREDGLAAGGFALGILESVKTIDSIRSVLAIACGIEANPELGDLASILECVGAFNRLVFFGRAPVLTEDDRTQSRAWLHAMLGRDSVLSVAQVATIYSALRGVGDRETITILAARPASTSPYDKVLRDVLEAIRSRVD